LVAIGILAVPASASALEQTLVASDGAQNDQFGAAVAVDGDTAVVGAIGADSNTGAAYVFTLSGESWELTGKLVSSDGAAGDQFGAAVAIQGDVIVVGAPFHPPNEAGAAYTFPATGPAVRTETAKLTASAPSADAQLGTSVAIDGETIVAGAPAMGTVGPGAAYTFPATGPSQNQTAVLTASDAEAGAALGESVAVDGDTIVAGAPLDDANSVGAAYTFATTGDPVDDETAKLTASDSPPNGALGTSVAIDGDTIVAGAPGVTLGSLATAGAAYTFDATGLAIRNETAQLTLSNPAANDEFALSVDISGPTILAGAPFVDVGPASAHGAAYTFASTGTAQRTETGTLFANDPQAEALFGAAVAIDGETMIGGSPTATVGANDNQGSATVFFQPTQPVPPNPPPDTTAPKLTLNAKGKQELGKPLKVKATCDEPCELLATGKLKLAGVRKAAKLKSARARAEANTTKTLKLALSKQAKRALKASGAQRGKATITVVATDAAGNASPAQHKKVKLK
jgi:hypothetical protein